MGGRCTYVLDFGSLASPAELTEGLFAWIAVMYDLGIKDTLMVASTVPFADLSRSAGGAGEVSGGGPARQPRPTARRSIRITLRKRILPAWLPGALQAGGDIGQRFGARCSGQGLGLLWIQWVTPS